MRTAPLILSFFLLCLIGYTQVLDTLPLNKKISFINHLKSTKQLNDAIYLSSHFNSVNPHDSLKLLEVKLRLDARLYRSADSLVDLYFSSYKDTVIDNCTRILIKNHCQLEKGQFSDLVEPKCIKHASHQEVWKLQLLISYLLQNKTEEFDAVFNSRKCNDPVLSLIEFDLYVQMMDLKRYHFKKPFVAGLLSAIVPGLGKVYTKKPHEALMAFLPVAFNFLQAAEGYYYEQWKSPHLYVFGSLGTMFYASNIAGSATSAKRKNQEFLTKIKDNIDFETAKLILFY